MLDDMRKSVRAGLEALASGASDDLAATLKSRAESFADQMSSLAAGFLEWSGEARASLVREVKDLVAGQVREMGLATKREVDALGRRVDRLEAAGRVKATTTSRPRPSATASTSAKRAKSQTKAKRPTRTSPSRRRSAGSGRR